MKKKFSFFMATILACALNTNVWADTESKDVTSTYLTNPSFEEETKQFLKINKDGRGVYKPYGWSVEWTQTATDQNGMTYIATSMAQDDVTWNANSDNAYFGRMRWQNATLNIRQTLKNLLPGSYTLSFYATAHIGSGASGTFSVSVAGQSTNVTVASNSGGTWSQYNISFTITSDTPYATIDAAISRTAGLFKFGLDDFTLTYDGSSYYTTICTEANTLYTNNKDWTTAASNTTFKQAIDDAADKTTVSDKNAAISSLVSAIAAYKEANAKDVTSLITNATFDSDISGWTTTGSDGTFQRQTSSQPNFNGGFLETWRNAWTGSYNHKNFDIYQTLNNLPSGEYTIKAAITAQMQGDMETFSSTTTYSNKKHGGPYYIDNEKGVWLYATSNSTTSNTWANTENGSFWGTPEYRSTTINVSNGTLTLGLKGIGSTSGGTSLGTYANWVACDNWSLSYFGFDATSALAELQTLYDECEDYDLDQKMNDSYKTQFQDSLTAAKEVLDDNTLQTKTNIDKAKLQLNNTYTRVKTSVATYAAITAKYNTLDGAGQTKFGQTTTGAKYNNNTLKNGDEWWSDYQTAVKAQTTENSNFTDLITNPSFETGTTDGWSYYKANDTGVYLNSNATYTISNADGNYIFNTWDNSTNTKYIEQSLSDLPVGIYAITALIASDAGNTVTLTDGTNSTSITASTDGKGTGVDGTLSSIAVTDGNLKIRLESTSWYKADNFRLTYLRAGATEEEANALKTRYNAVKDLKMNSTISLELETAYTNFNDNNTIVTYKALQNAVVVAENSVAYYAAITEKYNAMDDAGKAAFLTTETGAKYNANTLADEEWWSDYQTALRAQGVGATLTDLISNPDFKTEDISGWNFNDKATPTVNTSFHNCEFYEKDFDMSQTITNLKKGTYEITVQAFQRPGAANTELATNYKNNSWTSVASLYTTAQNSDVTHICAAWQDITGSVPEWIKNYSTITYDETSYAIPDGMEGGRAWFDQKEEGVGLYTVTAKATVTEEGGSLTFGFRGNMSSTDYAWLIFDNFTLKYTSTDVLVDEAESEKLITTATGLESEVMQGSVKDALTTAKEALESDKTNGTKYKTLNDAITAAQASVEAYSNLNTALTTYGAKAEALGGNYTTAYNTAVSSIQTDYDGRTLSTDEANAAVTTIAEAYETQRQAKNVDEYTTATTNCPDTYTVTFSGNCSSNSGQHWDGTSDTKYYDNWNASATTYSNTATVTLPSGDYAFVAAGRGQNVADSYISVQVGENEATTYHFNMKADAGYGIDTDGNATFANDATYANTTGRGWEWGTISFTVSKESEVTLTFGYNLAANSWASISNPALRCTKAVTAKGTLKSALDAAPTVPTANISETEPFKWNKKSVDALTSAISTAQGVYDSGSATKSDVEAQITAVQALTRPSINMLSATGQYGAKLVYEGYKYNNTFISFYTGTATGGYNGGYFELGATDKYQVLTFTPITDSENYTISFTDANDKTRYMCTGVPYSGNAYQIRTTTEASSALAITIIPSYTVEGIVNLYNTAANAYIGSQDQGVYTVNSHNDFQLKNYVSANMKVSATAGWGTFVAPFDIAVNALPDNVIAKTVRYTEDELVNTVVEGTIAAGTPVLLQNKGTTDAKKTFYGIDDTNATEFTTDNLVGTSVALTSVPTTYNETNNTYLLQYNSTSKTAGWYQVTNTGITLLANRAFLIIPQESSVKEFYLVEDDATGISNVDANVNADTIYNLAGQRVNKLQKGINIVNGKKVLY